MSGSGRKSQYRKGVTTQFDSDDIELGPGDQVGLVTANRGAHIFSVQLSNGNTASGKLPTKFHNVIWVKPRDYVVIETSTSSSVETQSVTEGTFPIKHILSKENIKSLKKSGCWPTSFEMEESRTGPTKHKGGDVVANDPLAGYEEDEELADEIEATEDTQR